MKPSTGRRAAVAATHVLLAALAACHSGPVPKAVAITTDQDTGNGTRHFAATHDGKPDDTITWDFGDGSTATGTAVDHAYARAGSYTVRAKAPDGGADLRVEEVDFSERLAGHACVPGSHWCWQDENVIPGRGRPAYFVDAQHGWTYGELGGGAVAATTDGGLTWTAQTVPSVHPLAAFRFADAQHGVVTSSANELWATDDGGATWRLVTSALPTTVQGAVSTPLSVTPGRIVLDAAQASTDGGRTWTALPLDAVTDVPEDADCWDVGSVRVMRLAGCTGTAATDVTPPGWRPGNAYTLRDFSSAQRVLLLQFGTPTLGWETLDAGATWQAFTPQGLDGLTPTGLQMTSPTAGWLAALDGTLHGTQDAGRTWSVLPLPSTFLSNSHLLTIGRLPDGNLWVSDGRSVARLADGGLSWDVLALPERDMMLWSMSAWSADGSVAAVVDKGTGWRLSGGAWQPVFGDTGLAVGSPVAFTARDARHAVAVGAHGVQRRTTDGVHWTTSSPFADGWGWPVALEFPLDGATGWLAQGGRLWTTADDGAHWQEAVTPGPLTQVRDVHFVDGTHGWVLDQQTGLYRSTDAGAHWSVVPLPAPGPWSFMAFVSPLRGMVVDGTGATWLTGDGARTWQAADPRPDVSRLKVTADGSIWAFGDPFMRSIDGGVTFKPALTQLAPPQDITFSDRFHGWVVDQGGSVSVTQDGGTTWTTTALGDGTVQLQGVATSDDLTGWIITTGGDLLFTANGG